ncbi:zinc ribbon domain-containing protein [Zavarzinella formosa]|uniref:hypothetical protein n=1 Tax=Zavarzinella formosa TaxID=360055 RepID=UPI0002D5F475|nr:hypothetical protein [Zavarzinella formosa]
MKRHNTCPECEAAFDFRPGLVGQTIRCQTCSHVFMVKGPDEDASSQSNKPKSAATAPPPLPPKKSRRDAEDDDRPRAKRNSYDRTGNRRDRNDDEDEPRNKAAQYREQDDLAGGGRGGSSPKRKSGGLMIGVIACVGVLFVAVLAGGVAWLAWPDKTKMSSTSSQMASNTGKNEAFTPVRPPRNDEPRNLDDILNQGKQNFPADPFQPPNIQLPPNQPFPRDPFGLPKTVKPPVALPKGENLVIKPLFPAPVDAKLTPADFLGNTTEIPSPHPITKVIPAGSGRYLLLHHELHQKVSVLDVPAAKIAKTIPLGQPKTIIAGGHDFFVAYLPDTKEFQRFSLQTMEPNQKMANRVGGEIGAIGMGAASNGPVVICLKEKSAGRDEKRAIQFLDPNTMQPGNYGIGGQRITFPLGLAEKPIALNVSGNGGVFTAWTKEFPAGVYSYVFGENGQANRYFEHIGPRTVFPSGNGKFLFSEGRIYGPDVKPVTEQVGGFNHKIWYLPAVTGPEYLMIEEKRQGFDKRTLEFEIRSTADKNTSSIPQVDGIEDLAESSQRMGFPMEQHFFLIPSAKTLAVHPLKNQNSIILCKAK